ncbi:MAG: hypothetical protein KBT88_08635 [Gammaproteobacteria bacterium]|nr:hypothetical protein [Gammaproteobacteria bacterium]MBQ0839840.1 hypothetical protein [Gammaproteobacteria bacterium]
MKKFVAISDDLLDSQPQVLAQLVPYHCDYPCQRLYRQPLEEVPGLAPVQLALVLQGESKSHE